MGLELLFDERAGGSIDLPHTILLAAVLTAVALLVGCAGIVVANLFALRSADPRAALGTREQTEDGK